MFFVVVELNLFNIFQYLKKIKRTFLTAKSFHGVFFFFLKEMNKYINIVRLITLTASIQIFIKVKTIFYMRVV